MTDTEDYTPHRSNIHWLSCGHSVPRKDHRWVTSGGSDACRQDCAERLERRGA